MFSYKYYDTPEGHDVFKKSVVTGKYAALAGLGMGTWDVLMYSHPKGFFNVGYRYAYFIGPLVGMATAFTLSANYAANVRGKNDKINYFLGGAVAGGVFGAWQRSVTVGVPAAIVLGAVAITVKMSREDNWSLLPGFTPAANSIKSVHHDFSLVKDIEELKTWTKGN
ncbi:NADH dehydrogenase [ubiquinone] 1 alpha subcomplex subunit 11 [Bicyclus anynana]|uniref:NADH dehydrogenase [ubiquinone] 1 alpha subcomplex subunit 11 n=1 Tax=Bicyclus anynana TaxID=110368 RepID=A0A6J1MUE2_BICAN|nr:NADH dehydrogenase [ubiquinone] 1 alpha subcomplex subunit 11 [Bicyclus anynana]